MNEIITKNSSMSNFNHFKKIHSLKIIVECCYLLDAIVLASSGYPGVVWEKPVILHDSSYGADISNISKNLDLVKRFVQSTYEIGCKFVAVLFDEISEFICVFNI